MGCSVSSEALRSTGGDGGRAVRRRPAMPRAYADSTASTGSIPELRSKRATTATTPDAASAPGGVGPQHSNRQRSYAYRDSFDGGGDSSSGADPLGSVPSGGHWSPAAVAAAAGRTTSADRHGEEEDCERIAARLRTPTARRRLFADRSPAAEEDEGESGGEGPGGDHGGGGGGGGDDMETMRRYSDMRPRHLARDLDERCGVGSSPSPAAIIDAVFADDPAVLQRVASMEDFAVQRYRQRRRANTQE